ncbi:MlaD family protein [Nitrosomonas sp. Nm58]|uniref:MlaD family protein n=1 Tax=Nitrosomonas sp. Nm58 TaxID=200126 RepID=UPI000897FEBA|nr:MlaD family protein [Nitrosomonas sp. Nm58]SDY55909.1 phospholipid/cholesterol/gamma-HCH transport system substrate-binding protein [Nitrosomonas sp. Nm58]
MENRAHALAAGLFVIILGMAVAAAVMWFSDQKILHDHYLLVSEEGSVAGLNPESSVRYRGVPVGKVEDIWFDPNNPNLILIRIAVSSNIVFPKNIYAQLATQGFTGLAFIELNIEGKEPHDERLSPDVRIPLRPSFIKELSSSFEDLVKNSNRAIERINSLLSEKNQTQINAILTNLAQAIRRYDSLADQLHSGIKSLPELATEASLALKQTHQLLSDINQAVVKINQQDGLVDGLTQNSQEIADTLPKLREISTAIMQSTHHIDRMLLKLEEQPQSLLFGSPPALPGPGESGFVPPRKIAP